MSGERSAQELTRLEQGMEQLRSQKKQFQQQLAEAQAALDALQTSKESFSIVGNLMLQRPKDELAKELSERLETLGVRVSTIDRQLEKMASHAKSLQQEIMEGKKKK